MGVGLGTVAYHNPGNVGGGSAGKLFDYQGPCACCNCLIKVVVSVGMTAPYCDKKAIGTHAAAVGCHEFHRQIGAALHVGQAQAIEQVLQQLHPKISIMVLRPTPGFQDRTRPFPLVCTV